MEQSVAYAKLIITLASFANLTVCMFSVFTRIILLLRILITSAKEDMFSSLFVCVFVCNFAQRRQNELARNF